MKNAVLILAGALVAGLALTFAPLKAQPAADGAAPAIQKWEYRSMSQGRRDDEPNFDDLGKNGWELVTVTVTEWDQNTHYCFKRPNP